MDLDDHDILPILAIDFQLFPISIQNGQIGIFVFIPIHLRKMRPPMIRRAGSAQHDTEIAKAFFDGQPHRKIFRIGQPFHLQEIFLHQQLSNVNFFLADIFSVQSLLQPGRNCVQILSGQVIVHICHRQSSLPSLDLTILYLLSGYLLNPKTGLLHVSHVQQPLEPIYFCL